MANSLVKQITVNFEDLLEKFDDELVLSKAAKKYTVPGATMQRSSDTIWRPIPNIATSGNGLDATADFTAASATQLSVPATLGFQKHSVIQLNGLELRDALTEGRLFDAAKQKLASDINVAINNVAATQGAITIKRTVAATGFDDFAVMDARMSQTGVPSWQRKAAISPVDYNGMASNLAARQTMNQKPTTAYERAMIDGNIAGFEAYKMDYSNRLTAAAGVTVTMAAANQFYTPTATTTQTDGSITPKDNRYQTISIAVTSGTVKVGDRFTVANVNSVHEITKQDTGSLSTHVIIAIVTGAGGTGTVSISPPFISGQGATQAELQYQNVTATPANGAAIVFLNTVAAPVNVFWQYGALELLPGRYEIPSDAGVKVMTGTTESGMSLTMSYSMDIKTLTLNMRVDTLFGVVMNQPQQAGVMLFNQT